MAISAKRPPRFKKEVRTCSDCTHWDGKGECLMYHYPADDDSVCDSFSAIPESDDVKGRLWKAHRRRLERTK